MPKSYTHLQAEERAAILIQQQQGCSLRQIARSLGRDASSITRGDQVTADATIHTGARAERLRNQARQPGKPAVWRRGPVAALALVAQADCRHTAAYLS